MTFVFYRKIIKDHSRRTGQVTFSILYFVHNFKDVACQYINIICVKCYIALTSTKLNSRISCIKIFLLDFQSDTKIENLL